MKRTNYAIVMMILFGLTAAFSAGSTDSQPQSDNPFDTWKDFSSWGMLLMKAEFAIEKEAVKKELKNIVDCKITPDVNGLKALIEEALAEAADAEGISVEEYAANIKGDAMDAKIATLVNEAKQLISSEEYQDKINRLLSQGVDKLAGMLRTSIVVSPVVVRVEGHYDDLRQSWRNVTVLLHDPISHSNTKLDPIRIRVVADLSGLLGRKLAIPLSAKISLRFSAAYEIFRHSVADLNVCEMPVTVMPRFTVTVERVSTDGIGLLVQVLGKLSKRSIFVTSTVNGKLTAGTHPMRFSPMAEQWRQENQKSQAEEQQTEQDIQGTDRQNEQTPKKEE